MNNHRLTVRIAGLDNTSNNVMNDAVELAQDNKCDNINTVHVFIGILRKTQFGKIFESNTGYSVSHVVETYTVQAEHGEYGHSEIDFFEMINSGRLNILSDKLAYSLANTASTSFMSGSPVDYTKLLLGILNANEECLVDFLNIYNLSTEDIKEMLNASCTIPSSLEDFVTDLTVSTNVLESTYVDTEKYTDEIIEILGRKKKPNVLLLGKAGVGKTAVAEAFAQRLAHRDVPDFLQDYHLCSVDGSTLTAGTKYRGEFEARVKDLLQFAEDEKVILFIDEIHSFVSAGSGSQGAETAGNMIKTKMNDGSIKVIGATTIKEFKRFIENDSALCRRMETVEIKEPCFDDAVFMVEESITDYEDFHSVRVPESVIYEAARLSDKYMTADSFPDKIYTIIDHASSHAKVNGLDVLDIDTINDTVSKLTGIPVDKLHDTNCKELLQLEERLGARVIGQDEAIKVVSKAIRRGKAGINDSNRPIASFLFVGSTGVGKTELCKVLSEEVAMGDMPFIRIDMSEFSDKISVNKLIGSAPGYVGYGEGGQLTEKVKHNPYSLILFDEIEKAHPDVFNVFLQILDDGRLTDAEGDTVDFTNCIIVMTSNAFLSGSKSLGFKDNKTDDEERRDKERRALKDLEATFRPEFLNRIDNIVLFNKLTKEQCKPITKLLLNKLVDRVMSEKHLKLEYTDKLVEYITDQGYSEAYGARNIRREIQNIVEDALADAIISGAVVKGEIYNIDWEKEQLCIKHKKKNKATTHKEAI